MKQSEINAYIADAMAFFAEHHYALPRWASWTQEDWRANAAFAKWVKRHQMGWDITDFGGEDFSKRGLVLFCLRNGIVNREDSVPYAEKLMVVRSDQETPYHCHRFKQEDIINRAGGKLVIELAPSDEQGHITSGSVDYRIDGIPHRCAAGTPLVLENGDSIRLEIGMYHRFYGLAKTDKVLVGEVSRVNDDLTDNLFSVPVGRFPAVEQDEPARYLLWSELPD